MKSIVKFALMVLLCVGFAAIKAENVTIVNKTGRPVYIALVTTTLSSFDKRIAKKRGQAFAKVWGDINTPLALESSEFITVANFPTKYSEYNRTLFVTTTPTSLSTALSQKDGMGNPTVKGNGIRVGSDKFVSIEWKNGKFVGSNNKYAAEGADDATDSKKISTLIAN